MRTKSEVSGSSGNCVPFNSAQRVTLETSQVPIEQAFETDT